MLPPSCTRAAAVFLGLSALGASAGSLINSDSRATLITQDRLDNLSVGAQFHSIRRDLIFENEHVETLEAYTYGGFVGYDILPWMTLYGTLGACQAKVGEYPERGSDKFTWSAGLNMNLWQMQINDPSFMAGCCSIRATAGYGQYESGNSDRQAVSWGEWSGALTLNYELYAREAGDLDRVPYSLLLSAGPAVSKISGDVETPAGKDDFDEDHQVGVAGSVVIFAAHNLSVGGHVQYYFDETTLGASLVYNF